MFNVIRKTLWDKRTFILGWSLGLMLLAYLMTLFFPSFSGGGFDQLADNLPPAMQGLLGSLQDWRTLPGYLGGQLFDIRFPLFASIMAILLAVGLSVGEEEKGYLRTLVALPISRVGIVLAKWLGIVAISLVTTLAVIVGVEVGMLQIGETLDQTVLLRLGLMTWLMMTALASLIYAFGMATGRKSLTTGVAVVVAIGSFIISTFSDSVDWLKPYDWVSIFHYFPAVDIAKGTIQAGDVLVYVTLIAISLIAALIFFPRRDIKD